MTRTSAQALHILFSRLSFCFGFFLFHFLFSLILSVSAQNNHRFSFSKFKVEDHILLFKHPYILEIFIRTHKKGYRQTVMLLLLLFWRSFTESYSFISLFFFCLYVSVYSLILYPIPNSVKTLYSSESVLI